MFSGTELALMNRANIAERDADRIVDQYRGMIAELKEAVKMWESTSSELNEKIRGWINYSKKLEARIDNARVYMKKSGLSDVEIERIIKG